MTCIVGFLDKKNDSVWIGGDSLGSNGMSKSVNDISKVFRNGTVRDVVMGGTGTFRHLDLLQYSTELFPPIEKYEGPIFDHKYMVTKFIPRVYNLFDQGIKSETAICKGCNFIVGATNKLFEVQDDYSVLEPADGFCAVGCGEYYAMGSLYTTKDMDIEPVEKIRMALEAAEHCGCGVQRPFIIINTKSDEKSVIN